MYWIKKWYNIFIIMSLSLIIGLVVYILNEKNDSESIRLTQEEREWLDANDGHIRIGADPDYIPMDFINQ